MPRMDSHRENTEINILKSTKSDKGDNRYDNV